MDRLRKLHTSLYFCVNELSTILESNGDNLLSRCIKKAFSSFNVIFEANNAFFEQLLKRFKKLEKKEKMIEDFKFREKYNFYSNLGGYSGGSGDGGDFSSKEITKIQFEALQKKRKEEHEYDRSRARVAALDDLENYGDDHESSKFNFVMDSDKALMALKKKKEFRERVDKCLEFIEESKDEHFDMVYDPKTIVEVSRQVYDKMMNQCKKNAHSLSTTISRLSTFTYTEPQGIKELRDVYNRMNNDLPPDDYDVVYKESELMRRNYVEEFLHTTESGILDSVQKNNQKIAKKAVDFYIKAKNENKVDAGIQSEGTKYYRKLERDLKRARQENKKLEKTFLVKIEKEQKKYQMKIDDIKIELQIKKKLCEEMEEDLTKTRTRLIAGQHTLQTSVNDIKRLKNENKGFEELVKENQGSFNEMLKKMQKLQFYFERICDNLKSMFPIKQFLDYAMEDSREAVYSSDEEGDEEGSESKSGSVKDPKCLLSKEAMIDATTMLNYIQKGFNELVMNGEDARIDFNRYGTIERNRKKLRLFYLSDVEDIKKELQSYTINPMLTYDEKSEAQARLDKEEEMKERMIRREKRRKQRLERKKKGKMDTNRSESDGNSEETEREASRKRSLQMIKDKMEQERIKEKLEEERREKSRERKRQSQADYNNAERKKGQFSNNPFSISDRFFYSNDSQTSPRKSNKKGLDIIEKILTKLDISDKERGMMLNLFKFIILGYDSFKGGKLELTMTTNTKTNTDKKFNLTGDQFHPSSQNLDNSSKNSDQVKSACMRKTIKNPGLTKSFVGKFGLKEKSRLSTERETNIEFSQNRSLREFVVGKVGERFSGLTIANADTVEKRIQFLFNGIDFRIDPEATYNNRNSIGGDGNKLVKKLLDKKIWDMKKEQVKLIAKKNKSRGYNLLPASLKDKNKGKKSGNSNSLLRIKSKSRDKSTYTRRRKIVERKQKTWRVAEVKIPEKIRLEMMTKLNPLEPSNSTVMVIDDIVEAFLDSIRNKSLKKSASSPKFPISKLPVFKKSNQFTSRTKSFLMEGEELPMEFIEKFRGVVEKEIKQLLATHKNRCKDVEGPCPHLFRLFQRLTVFFQNMYKNRGKLFKMNKVNIDRITQVERAKGFRAALFPKPGNKFLE